ncbi:hydantoinase B/oxoprolinase family protein [Streptomyces chartreusis]|uniref:hydantoinase B/oxoprolinase family protein n=1 Tax=Streptomyces chartreusis TaxID=1969 RepID=UPI003669AC5E
MTTIDPTLTATADSVRIEIIGNALESISDEMNEALIRTSYSPNVKERRDSTAGLFNLEGVSLAQAEHVPMHLASMIGIVNAVRERYPLEDIRDGDSFLGNDPHTGGATHLPDITLVTPIFVDGELAAWAVNCAHHADYADRGHEHIFQEGLRFPAVRLLRDWTYERDVLDIFLLNMQVPTERIADLDAQLASNRLGVNRYRDICARYGRAAVDAAGRELLDYSERKLRAGIRTVPNGVYEFTDEFDSNEFEGTFEISLRMTVEDDHIIFDFDGPPQARASYNMVRSALLCSVWYAAKTVVGPGIPSNGALERALVVNAPLGSVLNCVAPAAVYGRIDLAQRVVDLVHGAFAQVVPERVLAASNGAVTGLHFSGVDPRTDRYYVYVETIGGGYGAGAHFDGLDGVHAHLTNTSNLPVEALEGEYPLRVLEYSLVDGSGGVGTYRGGMGLRRVITVEHDDCTVDVVMSRLITRPWGLEGGRPAAPSELRVNDQLAGTQRAFPFEAGDRVSVQTAGGGGYGNPADRNPEAIARDLREGRIDAATATSYGTAASKRSI